MQLLLTLKNADTFSVAEAKKHVSGSLSIGRGKHAGWTLPDPTRMLSAVHCEIKEEPRGFTLTDYSRNGTRLNGEAIARLEAHTVSIGDEIEIGPYLIAVGTNDGMESHRGEKTVVSKSQTAVVIADKTVIAKSNIAAGPHTASLISPRNIKNPKQVITRRPSPTQHTETITKRFVDAFCEGAALDPDSLAGRSDMEFAHELGSLMRNMVSGLHAISHEITELRALIGSSENTAPDLIGNDAPASSAAEKRRQAEKLLTVYFGNQRPENTGADVIIGEAIDDARRHNTALVIAMQTALFRLLNELSPAAVERETKTGIVRSKSAKNWGAYVRRWEALNRGGEDGMLDVFLHYFGEAYDRKMQDL